MKANPNFFMLDSGAYSAWNSGVPIDIDQYIAYIRENIQHIDCYVALDVIPGSFGVVPTAAEVEASAEKSWENLLYMEEHGLEPIPVFHMGEQFKWLRKMVDHGCSYIGISPANDRTTQAKQLWLDRVFNEITDADGHPVVKTHAFGVTSVPLMLRYPWESVDSTTWILCPARGKIIVPPYEGGRFRYDRSPRILRVGDPVGDDPTAVAKHLHELKWMQSPSFLEHVKEFLAAANSSMEACADDYLERTRVCCYYFLEFERNYVKRPFKRAKRLMFEDR